MENKKIKNATKKQYNGIQFKSILETMVYKTLVQAGFEPQYEGRKFCIWEGFYPQVPFYNRNKTTKNLELDTVKLRDITYTPDFVFEHEGVLIIIEAKGMENDVFPVKKKLFRGWLEKQSFKSMYFEVYTKRNLLQAIEIIKTLKKDEE